MTTSIALDFGSPDFKIQGMESKYDFVGAPNSFIKCFVDRIGRFEAIVLFQFLRWSSWANSGVFLLGRKWIYKSVAKLIEEVFCGATPYRVRKALQILESEGFILREQLHREHYGSNKACIAYNRQYYISPVIEAVNEQINSALAKHAAKTTSTLGFSNCENQIDEGQKTDLRISKNSTHSTLTANSSQTPPLTPPSEKSLARAQALQSESTTPENTQTKKQEKVNPPNADQNLVDSKPTPFTQVVARPPRVEQKVNRSKVVQSPVLNEAEAKAVVSSAEHPLATAAVSEPVDTEVNAPRTLPTDVALQKHPNKRRKTNKGTKPSFDPKLAPWNSLEQFKKFYRALIASPYVRRMAKNLEALVNRIVVELKQGVPHPFWDDFIAGREIGSSTRQEWQTPDGSPHPDFIEYLAEKLIRGNNTQTREIAICEALRIAKDPETARFFWKECKVSLVNAKAQTERDRALGVSHPVTPTWTHERVEPTISEAAAASMEIKGINQQTTTAIEAAISSQAQLSGDSQQKSIAPDPDPDQAEARGVTPDPWVESAKPPKPKISDYAPLRVKAILDRGSSKKYRNKSAKRYAQPDEGRRQPLKISEMNFDEINKALTDPILRGELTPQLIFDSPYELITDELGRILRIEKPPE